MTSGAARLLRGREEQRATFLDLFFDLVFVFALFRLSQGLREHLDWSGAFQTLVLLLAVWWVWTQSAGVSDRFDPRRPAIQVLAIGAMFGSLVLAAAAPEAFGDHGLVFAGAYVAVQVGRSLFLVVLTRGDERQRAEMRVLFWFGVSAVPWLAGALMQGWPRGVLWALAVAVDYTVARLGWPTPQLGPASAAEFSVSGGLLAERHRQFFIIALGELILVTGLGLSSNSFAADSSAAVVVAFATTVLLWRIYIHRAGEVLGGAVAAAPDPLRVAVSSVYAHLVMVAGIVAISVGDELIIEHPFGHTPPAWAAVILGGPALFLAGRAIIEYTVFGRVSRDRVAGVLVLAAISPATIVLPPVLVAAAAALVLAAIAVSDAARARGRPPEPPSPPG
ncbi:low temperature requirement protein LtrA [Micromonospora kangleipakensis]|uniref:Low temperature requirement protein LtrA n=1 Tax=Micromonospora kangleipakensis TaxID=1077942 RepID=A0A4Q8B8R9_9ACTN|nr:low temperature requirement protein A [Micromonospora kangleipakensis]RZU73571.1 low temperature requirement protein LtrA [Micromonospora kangleipakensis]